MYVVKNNHEIKEDLCIQTPGKPDVVIHVHINVDKIMFKYNRARKNIGEMQHRLEEDPESEEAMTGYGAAILSLFELLFGEENTQKIVDVYENRYTDMLSDISPFIVEVVTPKMEDAVQNYVEKFARVNNALKNAQKAKKPWRK